jgi:signal transduction histidine kinase/ABC-type phosphate/phosphonate transport system substrate-binding protein
MRIIARICFALLLLTSSAAAEQPVVIGVLSFRPPEQTLRQWAPTAEYLARRIPGYQFKIVPMNYPDLDRAANEGKLNFVFTNPDHYVLLRNGRGMAAILTVMPLVNGHPVNSFGGVVVTRSDRADINELEDLAGRSVAAPSEESLGGNLMQLWEFYRRGIPFPKMNYLGMPHDTSVRAVVSGAAEAAFVRTGVLEAMSREGKLRMEDIKVLNAQPPGVYPQIVSTTLYPEWPFCASQGTPDDLVKAVSLALLELGPDDPAAKAGNYYGFSPPGDYAPVEAVMLRLRVHPGRLQQFDLRDVIGKYASYLVGALGVLLLMAGAAAVYMGVVNRRLGAVLAEQTRLSKELIAVNGDLERFSEILAHHFSEAARTLAIHADLLGRAPDMPTDAKATVSTIRNGGRRLLALLRDVQNYLSVGHMPLEGECSADHVLDRVLSRHAAGLNAVNAEIHRTPLGRVRISEPRLTQVLAVLVENALQYRHPDRRLSLQIRAEAVEGRVILAVKDNGLGIDPQYHQRIFRAFERLHSVEEGSSTGIGLALAKRAVEGVGGTLSLASELGQWTEFRISLPPADGQP